MSRENNNPSVVEVPFGDGSIQDTDAMVSVPLVASNGDKVKKFPFMSLFPAVASVLFAVATDPKKPEQIALAASMLTATTSPVLSNLARTSKDTHQHIETISGAFMTAAVAMMGLGAIKGVEKSDVPAAIVALTAISLFGLFALTNTGYNLLKSLGIIQSDKPLVEFIASSSGLLGSILFFVTQGMNYGAAKASGNASGMESAKLLMGASCLFIGATGHGAVDAARRVRNQQPELVAASGAAVPGSPYGAAA